MRTKIEIVTYRVSCNAPEDMFVPYEIWPEEVSKETLKDLDDNGSIPCEGEQKLTTFCGTCRFGAVDWIDSEEER